MVFLNSRAKSEPNSLIALVLSGLAQKMSLIWYRSKRDCSQYRVEHAISSR